ncbi:MAG: RNA polymerase sigma factor SigX [Bacillota bacterium]
MHDNFLRYYPAICRQLTCLLGDDRLAEDIAQETFIRLYQSPPRDPGKTGGWLFKVARNLAYNLIRSEKSRTVREMKVQAWNRNEVSSEEIVIGKEEAEMVHKVLNSLDERDRTCLIMKFSGFSYDDIAKVAGVKKTSVGTIIARAQAKFRNRVLEMRGVEL